MLPRRAYNGSISIANEVNTADISDYFEVGHTEKSTSNCFPVSTKIDSFKNEQCIYLRVSIQIYFFIYF